MAAIRIDLLDLSGHESGRCPVDQKYPEFIQAGRVHPQELFNWCKRSMTRDGL
jgi:hypothetical protein